MNHPLIGWDDVKCRPIYYARSGRNINRAPRSAERASEQPVAPTSGEIDGACNKLLFDSAQEEIQVGHPVSKNKRKRAPSPIPVHVDNTSTLSGAAFSNGMSHQKEKKSHRVRGQKSNHIPAFIKKKDRHSTINRVALSSDGTRETFAMREEYHSDGSIFEEPSILLPPKSHGSSDSNTGNDLIGSEIVDDENRKNHRGYQTHPQKQMRQRRSYGLMVKRPIYISKNLLSYNPKKTDTTAKDTIATLIGWDDKKCRPIYYARKKRDRQLQQEDLNVESLENHDLGAPYDSGKPSHFESPSISRNKNSNTYNDQSGEKTTSQKKRVYGSHFRRKAILQGDDIASPVKLFTVTPALNTQKSRRVTFSDVQDVILLSVEEEEKFTTVECRNRDSGERCESNTTVNTAMLEKRIKKKSSKRCAAIDSDALRNSSPNNFLFEEFDTTTDSKPIVSSIDKGSTKSYSQPTSKSSLDSARAYFQDLVSNHNFTILERDIKETDNRTQHVIRT